MEKEVEMEKVQQIKKLYEEVRKELLQVTWPDKKEMTTAIIIVSFAVLIAGSAFFAVDYFLYSFVQLLIKV
jgi:preprotein translocase SecE subunit